MSEQQREYYECRPGSNCQSDGLPLPINALQDTVTGCTECASIHSAMNIRTKFDKFWIKFYNGKAQSVPTDLMTLQFAQ